MTNRNTKPQAERLEDRYLDLLASRAAARINHNGEPHPSRGLR